jgi:CRISPR/Cas system-associated protein Cas10 (large subunit of type III CRISPR-Cas system)
MGVRTPETVKAQREYNRQWLATKPPDYKTKKAREWRARIKARQPPKPLSWATLYKRGNRDPDIVAARNAYMRAYRAKFPRGHWSSKARLQRRADYMRVYMRAYRRKAKAP